jgi:hypothetical protein
MKQIIHRWLLRRASTSCAAAQQLLRSVTRAASLLLMIAAFAPTAYAAGVVGTGTNASCTEAAFDTALTGGGDVTFNCGPGTTTIVFTATKNIAADTNLTGDPTGATKIVLSGGNAVKLFVSSAISSTGAIRARAPAARRSHQMRVPFKW